MSCPKCEKYEKAFEALRDILGLTPSTCDVAFEATPPKFPLEFAIEEIGVEEVPRGSNDGKRVREYLRAGGCTIPAPWCAGFVMWCLKKSGVNPNITTAHVATMWDKHKDIQKFTPKAGDVFVMINRNGTGHTGFVERVHGDLIDTVEGNTNDEGQREGYEVCRRTRSQKTIRGYLRFEVQ